MEYLEGELLYKGERGYSAYEIAVQNGFKGTEKDWLATLGTSSYFDEDTASYTATANQTVFNLPSSYHNYSFVDVYVNGLRLNSSEYTLNKENLTVTLTNALDEGTPVEIVVLSMSTNSLPISSALNEQSTDDTAASSKAVYEKDFLMSNGNKVTLPPELVGDSHFVVDSTLTMSVYPVGSVICLKENIDPNMQLGGTWGEIGTQRIGVVILHYWAKVGN